MSVVEVFVKMRTGFIFGSTSIVAKDMYSLGIKNVVTPTVIKTSKKINATKPSRILITRQ
jgi:hypothetical protein